MEREIANLAAACGLRAFPYLAYPAIDLDFIETESVTSTDAASPAPEARAEIAAAPLAEEAASLPAALPFAPMPATAEALPPVQAGEAPAEPPQRPAPPRPLPATPPRRAAPPENYAILAEVAEAMAAAARPRRNAATAISRLRPAARG